jgi:putative ABC transport system substrate-binding protein
MQRRRFAFRDELEALGRANAVGRRAVLGLVGGAVLLPGVGRTQPLSPVIGFLHDGSPARASPLMSAFWRALNRAGFVENRNIAVTYRWGEGHDERLPALALDLCRQDIAILVAGGARSVAAASQATDKIPIIFVAASDPAGSGFDLDRPEGNITGVSVASPELLAERFRTLLKIAPTLRSAMALVNPQALNIDVQLQYLHDETKRRGIYLQLLNASGQPDFAAALEVIEQRQQDALLVANDAFLNSGRDRLVAVTRTSKLPAAFANREFVEAGGLMSYGPNFIEAYEQAGDYVGRILKGEKPAELAIQHPLEMEVALNIQVAKELGLEIPPALRAAAGEVIG